MHHTFNMTEVLQDNNTAIQGLDKIDEKLKHPDYVRERLQALEKKLKEKFSNNWVSVRKAFLDLDFDNNGLITAEDIIKYFGADNEFPYSDLKKLMIDRDHHSEKDGKLNYQDFSKWVCNYIHLMQGFYFRHDSKMNPPYERNVVNYQNKIGKFKDTISKNMIKQEDVMQVIVDKIKT